MRLHGFINASFYGSYKLLDVPAVVAHLADEPIVKAINLLDMDLAVLNGTENVAA